VFPTNEYIKWAKENQGRASRPLSWSNVPALTASDIQELGIDTSSVELSFGASGNDGAGLFRERIAARRGVSEDRVLVALGTTGANFAVLAANLEERGSSPSALIETPVYSPLVRTLEGLGYRVGRFERARSSRYALDPDHVAKAWIPGTAVVVVTSLHNPTGVAAGRGELEAVARLCEQRGALLLSDEVYREFADEGVAPGAYPLSPAVCSTESLSKAFGLAELRAGWAIGSERLIARARRVLDHLWGDAPAPSRSLAGRALERWDALVARARAIAGRNREAVDRFLAGRRDLAWVPPAGGVHGLIEFREAKPTEPVDAFQERLLREESVLVVPGRFFEAPWAFRIGWGGELAKVEDALAGLGRALDRRGA
jgi:aspartate/methionine/tyrosine aminotransferase